MLQLQIALTTPERRWNGYIHYCSRCGKKGAACTRKRGDGRLKSGCGCGNDLLLKEDGDDSYPDVAHIKFTG